jgi:hypothetical protein
VLGYLGLGLALFALGRWMSDGMGLNALVAGTLCMLLYLGVVFLADGRSLLRRWVA